MWVLEWKERALIGKVRLQNSRFFFSKSVKKSVKRGARVLRAPSARASHARMACEAREKKTVSPQSRSLFSASFQTFCLTARAYLNTQKYGLFCSLRKSELQMFLLFSGGHTGPPKLYTNMASGNTKLYKGTWNVSENNPETGPQKPDLDIVYISVSDNISSQLGFFHCTVSNLFFCCVTAKTIYKRYRKIILDNCNFCKLPVE